MYKQAMFILLLAAMLVSVVAIPASATTNRNITFQFWTDTDRDGIKDGSESWAPVMTYKIQVEFDRTPWGGIYTLTKNWNASNGILAFVAIATINRLTIQNITPTGGPYCLWVSGLVNGPNAWNFDVPEDFSPYYQAIGTNTCL